MFLSDTMLDPVTAISLSSSLDQLVVAATSIICNMIKYYEAVRDAPKRSRDLLMELLALSDLLKQIVDVIYTQTTSTFRVPGSFSDSVAEMRETLEHMSQRVQPSKTEGLRRLKWPFNKEENERLLFKIERYRKILSTTLNVKTA